MLLFNFKIQQEGHSSELIRTTRGPISCLSVCPNPTLTRRRGGEREIEHTRSLCGHRVARSKNRPPCHDVELRFFDQEGITKLETAVLVLSHPIARRATACTGDARRGERIRRGVHSHMRRGGGEGGGRPEDDGNMYTETGSSGTIKTSTRHPLTHARRSEQERGSVAPPRDEGDRRGARHGEPATASSASVR